MDDLTKKQRKTAKKGEIVRAGEIKQHKREKLRKTAENCQKWRFTLLPGQEYHSTRSKDAAKTPRQLQKYGPGPQPGRNGETEMKAFTSSTYESTKVLNPDASWSDAISGGYEGGVSIYNLDIALAAEVKKALRGIALKQDDERKAAALLTLCADIADSMMEAETRAAEREAEAMRMLQEYNEAHSVKGDE